MNRKMLRAVLAGAAITLTGVGAAEAGMPGFGENQYEGRIERDSFSYLGFDVEKKQGARRVTNVGSLMKYPCAGSGHLEVFGSYDTLRSIKVKPDGRFGGSVRSRSGDFRIETKLRGRLLAGGRAKGTLRSTANYDPVPVRADAQRLLLTRCYTGTLRWQTKKGADAPLPMN